MTEKELKKLSRADLLEMLIDQSTELQDLREKLAAAETALQQREITINQAGSIAEASLQLSGVFEAAQAACQQYIDNIQLLSQRQSVICQQRERDSCARANHMVAEAERRCAAMEADTRRRCNEMLARAQAESQAYWNYVSGRTDPYGVGYPGQAPARGPLKQG